MSVTGWIADHLKLGVKTESDADKIEHQELIDDTLSKVEEVSKLRENLFEDREFPITDFLRRSGPPRRATPRRVKQ
jgi:hypothetical protein